MSYFITRELERSCWQSYFEALAARMPSAGVTVELVDELLGRERASELELSALLYDAGSDVFEIAAAPGERPGAVVRHFVEHPLRIFVQAQGGGLPHRIAIDGGDGHRTLIGLSGLQQTARAA